MNILLNVCQLTPTACAVSAGSSNVNNAFDNSFYTGKLAAPYLRPSVDCTLARQPHACHDKPKQAPMTCTLFVSSSPSTLRHTCCHTYLLAF